MCQCIWNFFDFLKCVGNSLQSFFLFALRLVWGTWFFQSGLGKWNHFGKVVDYFGDLGIPYPELNAYMAMFTEMLGGLLLIFGLFSRLISIPLIITMLVAYATADHEVFVNIFNDFSTFVSETPFTFLLVAVIVFIFGPGKFSLDHVLERYYRKNP